MAIAKMERLSLVAPLSDEKRILKLIQSFQRVELYRSEQLDDDLNTVREIDIDSYSENINLIRKARDVLAGHKKSDAIQKLRTGRQILTLSALDEAMQSSEWMSISENAVALNDQLQENRKRRRDLKRMQDEWGIWRELKVLPEQLDAFKRTKAVVGSLPIERFDSLLSQIKEQEKGLCVYEVIFKSDKKAGVLIAGQRKAWQHIFGILSENEFTEVQYTFAKLPAEMLSEWDVLEKETVQQEDKLHMSLKELSSQTDLLDTAEEYFQNKIIREKAKQLLPSSKTCFLLSGWIIIDDKDALEKHLEKHLSTPYCLTFSEPLAEEAENVPISLKNNKVFGVFESLTETYSMPAYDEIDPTPFMTPFYFVFFGMMVADMGYGLILLIATFIARKFLKPDRELKRSIDFFYYLSYPVIVWGLIYGSIFGLEMPFKLLSQTDNMIEIIIVSIGLGFIQIILGLCVSCYLNLKKKNILDSIANGFAWIGLLFGLLFMILDGVVFKLGWLMYAGAALSSISALSIVVINILQSKHSPAKGMMKGLYALYGATGYIGDLVSYTRLMALGIAGGSIAVAFNTIITTLPLPARLTFGVLLALALQALNLFLSLLGAYVHGIRLQYVEFFGKFYSGGGRKFAPFKPAEKYVYIVDSNDNDK